MECPYPDCKKSGMIPPSKPYGTHPHGYCPHCKRKSRAALGGKDNRYISYSVTSRKRLADGDIKNQHSVRYSENREAEILARGYTSMQDFVDRG